MRFYIIVGLIVLCLLLVAALAALIIRKPPHGPEDGGGSAGGDSEAHNSRRGNVRRDRYEAEEKPTEVKNSATGDHKSGAGAPGEAGDTSLLERKARAVIHNEERTLETELALEASKMWEQDDDELFETVELGTEEKRDEDDGDDFEFLDINL